MGMYILEKNVWFFIVHLIFLLAYTCGMEIFGCLLFKNRKKLVFASLKCNVLTNPTLNLMLPFVYFLCEYFGRNALERYGFYYICILILEVGVVFLETWLLSFFTQEKFAKRLLISTVINTMSALPSIIIAVDYMFSLL